MSPTLSVSGNKLLRDGKPFIPTGFNSVAPYHANPTFGYGTVFKQYPNSVKSIGRLNGNTVVLKVLQAHLYSDNPTYMLTIMSMVETAHIAGLSVILCMQDQVATKSGIHYSDMTTVITEKTFQAWAQLAPEFASDLDVAFELFNEPDYPSTNWNIWRNAMQPLITQIRKTNGNLIWVPGGSEPAPTGNHKQMTLHGLGVHSLLKGSNLGYSVHPYNYAHVTPTELEAWHDRYFYVTSTAPLLFSEGYFDRTGSVPLTVESDFLSMAKSHSIGYCGWVIDSPDSQQLVAYDVSAPVWNPQPTTTGKILTDWFITV